MTYRLGYCLYTTNRLPRAIEANMTLLLKILPENKLDGSTGKFNWYIPAR